MNTIDRLRAVEIAAEDEQTLDEQQLLVEFVYGVIKLAVDRGASDEIINRMLEGDSTVEVSEKDIPELAVYLVKYRDLNGPDSLKNTVDYYISALTKYAKLSNINVRKSLEEALTYFENLPKE